MIISCFTLKLKEKAGGLLGGGGKGYVGPPPKLLGGGGWPPAPPPPPPLPTPMHSTIFKLLVFIFEVHRIEFHMSISQG